jgi:NAD+ synthetase
MISHLTEPQAVNVIANIRRLLQEYFQQHGLKYAVFGKSEGLDSSVIAGLLSDIPGIQPIGVLMPIESKPEVKATAREVLDFYHIPSLEADLSEQFRSLRDELSAPGSIEAQLQQIADEDTKQRSADRLKYARGNIKVRLRMITLYHIAQLLGGAVISTDNYSEFWMGFWTLNGDVGDIAPIQQVFKGTELYDIAQALHVPVSSLNAIPSDGLGITENGYDHDQLGLPYPELDRVVVELLQSDFQNITEEKQGIVERQISDKLGFPLDRVRQVSARLISTEFKRHWPVVFTRQQVGLTPII